MSDRREPPFPSTRVFEGVIDADAVAAFALATNDPNPRYLDGLAVPPLFSATMILEAQHEAARLGVSHEDVTGRRGSAHGEHDVYLLAPLRPGMVLRWTGVTASAHQTRSGVLVVQRITVTDTGGRPMVVHLWSSFHIGARIDSEIGEPAPIHRFPEDARSRPLGERVVRVDRDQAFRYAGVSGDRAGHAISDDIAQFEGYPSKILQGMCTFSLTTAALVDLVAGGDPDRLRRLAVRFAAPAFPARDLVVRTFEAGRSSQGYRSVAFEVEQAGVTVLEHGRVEIAG